MSDSSCGTYDHQIKSGLKIKNLTMIYNNATKSTQIDIEYKLFTIASIY